MQFNQDSFTDTTGFNPEDLSSEEQDCAFCADDFGNGALVACAVAGGAVLAGMATATIGGFALIAFGVGTLVSDRTSPS